MNSTTTTQAQAEALPVGEAEEHGLRPLAVAGIESDDITYGQRPSEPHAAPSSSAGGVAPAQHAPINLPSQLLESRDDVEAAMLDASSPARGLLKKAEAERLAHVTEPRSDIKFVKGGTQPAKEGAI